MLKLLTISVISLCLPLFSHAAIEISDGSVIGLWHLNGDSVDATGNAHNGTDTNITYGIGMGKFAQGASFNGSTSKITITDHTNLKPTSTFSIALWVNASTTGDYGLFQSYNNTGGLISGFRTAIIQVPGDYSRFVSGKNTGTTQGTDFQQNDSSQDIVNNTWNFLVFVYDGTTLKTYTNGSTIDSTNWTNNPVYNATNYVQIGMRRQNATDGLPLLGYLDEIALFNTALSSTTISQLYNNGTGETICTTVGCADTTTELCTTTICTNLVDNLILALTTLLFVSGVIIGIKILTSKI